MCGSMVDIQSAAAEIGRGKKKEERRKKKIETTGQKYNSDGCNNNKHPAGETGRVHVK